MKAHIPRDVAQRVKSLFRAGLVSQFIAVTGGVALDGLIQDILQTRGATLVNAGSPNGS